MVVAEVVVLVVEDNSVEEVEDDTHVAEAAEDTQVVEAAEDHQEVAVAVAAGREVLAVESRGLGELSDSSCSLR